MHIFERHSENKVGSCQPLIFPVCAVFFSAGLHLDVRTNKEASQGPRTRVHRLRPYCQAHFESEAAEFCNPARVLMPRFFPPDSVG